MGWLSKLGGWIGKANPVSLISGAIGAIAKGGPKRQYKWNKKAAEDQNRMNRENAEWELAQNRILSQEQRDYDSPKMQMERFKAAGLNPHLAYTQGNVGNMNSPLSMPHIAPANYGHVDTEYANPIQIAQQSELMSTQMGLSNQKIDESKQKVAQSKAQERVLKSNPYLDPSYLGALVSIMENTAFQKQAELQFYWDRPDTQFHDQLRGHKGYEKMQAELELLFKRNDLLTSDKQVKAKIIEGKGFENDLKEIQSRWMRDGEITPEHIRQGIMMFLSRLK